jgi:hypothetical protein
VSYGETLGRGSARRLRRGGAQSSLDKTILPQFDDLAAAPRVCVSRGDSYGNALVESLIGLCHTEVIGRSTISRRESPDSR